MASQCPCLRGWVLGALRRGPAIYWQENLALAAAGNPEAIFGLDMAWSRLGHSLDMAWSWLGHVLCRDAAAGFGGPGELWWQHKGFWIKRNDAK